MKSTRRELLVGGVRVTALLPTLSILGKLSPLGASPPGAAAERALVVLQLTGGNDGLNTLVPHRQDAYYRLRPTLGLARGSLHPLDADHGLHPAMGGLAQLFADGRLAVIHGVGYPAPNRSHFRSMEIWHTADPLGHGVRLGWLGRLADSIVERSPGSMAALQVGEGELPLALRGRSFFPPTVPDEQGFHLEELGGDFARLRERLLERSAGPSELLFLREAATMTYRAAERMSALAERTGGSAYPDLPLARGLRLVARLLSGGFGTRLFFLELGGFDTHARQAPSHAALLAELSRSLEAFQRDLEASGVAHRVLTLVFSEFGRRTAENGSKGTDHGAAAPVLLVGESVAGGLHGTPPDLEQLERGDVPFTSDFRSIYTTLERDWMGLEPSTALPALDLLGA